MGQLHDHLAVFEVLHEEVSDGLQDEDAQRQLARYDERVRVLQLTEHARQRVYYHQLHNRQEAEDLHERVPDTRAVDALQIAQCPLQEGRVLLQVVQLLRVA